MILQCSCKSPYQDARYGGANRVHNPSKPKTTPQHYRCSVCGTERTKTPKGGEAPSSKGKGH